MGNHRSLRGGNHIGGVQTAAQAGLQHHDIALRLQKIDHPNGGHQLELGLVLRRLQHLGGNLRQVLPGDGRAVHLEALVEGPQVGGGVQAGFQPRRREHRGQHGGGGALAVGPGDVDKFQLLLGVAQPSQQAADAVKPRLLAHPGPLMDEVRRFLSRHGVTPPEYWPASQARPGRPA